MGKVTIESIFQTAQQTAATHKKCVKQLNKLAADEPKEFVDKFLTLIKLPLLVYKREPAVERLISLIINFSTHTDLKFGGESFPLHLVRQLVPLTALNNVKKGEDDAKAVRFRSCQVIAGVLHGLPDDADLPEDIFDVLTTAFLERTKDKIPVIREHACSVLGLLQDPTNPSDEVTLELVRLMGSDTNKDVRKAALSHIAITKRHIPEIMKRARDVVVEVRRHTFTVLAANCELKHTTIAQRATLLLDGLKDREQSVRDACIGLCMAWMRAKDLNIVKFAEALDVEVAPEAISLVIKELFKVSPIDLSEIYENDLTPESVLVWRVACDTFREEKRDGALDDALPELIRFGQLVQKHAQEHPFILKHLLCIIKNYDFSDEVGRKFLFDLLRAALSDLEHIDKSVIPAILEVFRMINTDRSDYIRLMLEVLAEVREPIEWMEDPDMRAQIEQVQIDQEARRRRIVELKKRDRNNEEIAMLEREYEEVERNEETRERLENLAWERALMITEDLLRFTVIDKQDPGISDLQTTLLAPALRSPDPKLRGMAMRSLGMYTLLLDRGEVRHQIVFMHALKNDETPVKQASLQTLFDMASSYGTRVFSQSDDADEKPQSSDEIIKLLAGFLEPSTEGELLITAVEGFAKLFFADVIDDFNILVDMLLLMWNPDIEDANPKVVQCLSVFFPNYSFRSLRHQKRIVHSFIPTIRRAVYQVGPSVESSQPMQFQSLVHYFVHLTTREKLPKAVLDALEATIASGKPIQMPQHELADLMLQECVTSPSGKETKFIAKALSSLQLDSRVLDGAQAKILRMIADRVVGDVPEKDKVTTKALTEFSQLVKKLDPEPDGELPVDEEEFETTIEATITAKARWLAAIEHEIKRPKYNRRHDFDDDIEDEDDYESENEPKQRRSQSNSKAPVKKRAAPKKAAAAKKAGGSRTRRAISESEEESDGMDVFDSEEDSSSSSDFETEAPRPRPTRQASQLATQKLTTIDDSESDIDDMISVSDSDDEDGDDDASGDSDDQPKIKQAPRRSPFATRTSPKTSPGGTKQQKGRSPTKRKRESLGEDADDGESIIDEDDEAVAVPDTVSAMSSRMKNLDISGEDESDDGADSLSEELPSPKAKMAGKKAGAKKAAAKKASHAKKKVDSDDEIVILSSSSDDDLEISEEADETPVKKRQPKAPPKRTAKATSSARQTKPKPKPGPADDSSDIEELSEDSNSDAYKTKAKPKPKPKPKQYLVSDESDDEDISTVEAVRSHRAASTARAQETDDDDKMDVELKTSDDDDISHVEMVEQISTPPLRRSPSRGSVSAPSLKLEYSSSGSDVGKPSAVNKKVVAPPKPVSTAAKPGPSKLASSRPSISSSAASAKSAASRPSLSSKPPVPRLSAASQGVKPAVTRPSIAPKPAELPKAASKKAPAATLKTTAPSTISKPPIPRPSLATVTKPVVASRPSTATKKAAETQRAEADMNRMLADTVKQPTRAIPRTGKATATGPEAKKPKPAISTAVSKPPTKTNVMPAKTPNSKRRAQQAAIADMDRDSGDDDFEDSE